MRVLILGASGYIGRILFRQLQKAGWAEPGRASRGPGRGPAILEHPHVDSRDPQALANALRKYECVINCVAGDFDSIAKGAECLARVAKDVGCQRIVHLSTMSVYGRQEGLLSEQAPLDPTLGWYAAAKCAAEDHMRTYARGGGTVAVLRPGCVYGAGSELWVGRPARWLHARRIGDIGAAGDGCANLVHVEDVCAAVLAATRLPLSPGELATYNLAAPDSPRWNEYLIDLALGVGATPVRRISARKLQLDAYLAGPPLKVIEKILDRVGIEHRWLPDPLPPALLRLWRQDIRLDSAAASKQLALRWTDYASGLKESCEWFRDRGRSSGL